MPDPSPAPAKRPRDKYSRLICLGCHARRIRCELPNEVELPNPGELRTAQTPCHRCKRLGVPCLVRQTILGRPSQRKTGDVSHIIVELPLRPAAPTQPDTAREEPQTLLIHTPLSTETAIIIRAMDTLRRENVEEEWFRHLPAHAGHTRALDLSIKALVAACAYNRGVPRLTSRDCYQSLALALNAVQAAIQQSGGKPPSDDILASTALLAPFEGILVSTAPPLEGLVKKHGIPNRPHIEGLAAILAARPATYPVSQLARDILDFYACESAVVACIQGTSSPFESVSRAYFASNSTGNSDGDQAQIKALGNELFIRLPRLVGLVRSLRAQSSLSDHLLSDAMSLSNLLLETRDSQAEERLLRNITVHPSNDYPVHQSLQFASVKDFEALAYYWQSRLSLLRLVWHLQNLSRPVSSDIEEADSADHPAEVVFQPTFVSRVNEMFQLVKNILMCSEYARTLRLRKHDRLFAHAMVVVWGVTTDVPVAVALSLDQGEGTGTTALSDFLLRKVNLALAAKPDFTPNDMNTAADIFVGGQPGGRFAALYAL
ncbi:hypothetical protein B0H63DRAFT_389226 [Podospora didyma]|uniref:Zn(2)-C6 fungal-type domain-containing protein n=1 Tax=Podospora didyma TaxID=330526 RepID=A0AAE0NZR5_9PEZI|nr:hypothetical protein B0H63DRAFT_389226 [Podospora didyma]